MTDGTTDRPGDHRRRVVMVAAVADNGVIGAEGDMPWHLPHDLRHFRETTRGHTVIMGRVTYEGIGRPLPHRTNIVVTRQAGWTAEGVLVAASVEEALEAARGLDADIVIGGGSQIYERAFPHATHQILTEVHASPAGDTFYPPFDRSDWVETRREDHEDLSWVWLERRGTDAANGGDLGSLSP